MIVAIDQIDDFIARAIRVGRQLARDVRALHRDRRNDPGQHRREGEEGDREERADRLHAAVAALAEMRHERIEQVG